MSDFDELSQNGKLSAIYEQVLMTHEKINDLLARLAALEARTPVTEKSNES